jgi:hypothetical protein
VRFVASFRCASACLSAFERRILFVCRKTFEAKGTLKILGKHFHACDYDGVRGSSSAAAASM